MNELQIFDNPEFSSVRVVAVGDEPWWCGKDICDLFGDTNHNRSLGRIDDGDKRRIEVVDALGRAQTAVFINEAGVYALLFAMQPQKANNDGVSDAYPIEVQARIEKLRRFKRWVTSEVLPAIRRTGAYSTLAQRKAELAALMREQDGKISKYAMGKLALMAAQLITGLPIPGAPQSGANKPEREETKDAVARYMRTVYPSEQRPMRVSCAALYERFKAWCEANGCEPCGRGRFFKQLTAQGFGSRRRLYRSPITDEVTRGYDLV